jgi:hypothetical protein
MKGACSMDDNNRSPRIVRLILTIGAIAGAIVALFALFDRFFPEASVARAELSGISNEYDITLRDFLIRTNQPVDTYSIEELDHIGLVVNFIAEIEGYKGKPCKYSAGIYYASTKSVASGEYDLGFLTPENNKDRATPHFWIGYPNTSGRYFVRVELYDPDGIRLHFADSELFDVTIR